MKKNYDILVIDDEQVVIDSVIKLCLAENLTVDSVLDASDGLEKVKKKSYKLIICDIMMPNMDGFEFLDQIKKENFTDPIIMTTGYSTVENAVKSLYCGAIDFLPKPFTVDELISVVFRGLKYRKLINEIKSSEEDNSKKYISHPPDYLQLGYSSWLQLENIGSAKIGITDIFLKTIKEIEKIKLFNIDEEIVQGNPCAYIKTKDDLTHQVLSPLTGRIIEANYDLNDDLETIKKDPYSEGWLYSIIPSDPDFEIKHLKNSNH